VAEDRSIKVRVMLIEELIESAHCVFVGLVTCDRRDRDLMAFSPSLEVLLILVNIVNAGLGFGNDRRREHP
jgi:hypothetical protein